MRASVSLAMFVVTGVVVGAAACGSSTNTKVGTGASGGTGGTGGTGANTSGTTSGTTTGTTTTTSGTTTGTTTTSGTTSAAGTTIAPAGGHTSGCAPSETAPAPSTPFPFPPVADSGDPVIAAAKIVSITFSTEANATQIAAFGDGLASSCYWDAIRAGYCNNGSTTACIGDGPTGVTIGLSMSPASSYTDPSAGGGTLQTFLQGLITAGTVPAPDSNTIYQMYFPMSTAIDMDGAQSCQAFDGYHGSMVVGSQTAFYSVIPECTAPQMTPQITTLQNTTITASHEAIETATDGNLAGNGGYYLDTQNSEATWGWDDIQGGEVADLCVDPFLLGLDEFTENGFIAQRIWSVPNAAAGKNPCVPIPAGEVYFNAYPEKTTLVMNVGDSQTITVHAQADGTMPAWTLLPQDWTDYTGQTTYLSFSFGDAGVTSAQVSSGDAVPLTITLTADPSSTQSQEADGVLVSANSTDPNSVTAAHFWPFVVITTAQATSWGATEMKRIHHRHQKNVRPHRRYRNPFGGFR
jgi:hypothetical protein